MTTPGIQETAKELYDEGRFREAGELLLTTLREAESSDLWNDWGAVQVALGRVPEAKNGFRRALELEPESAIAAANLGALLFVSGQRDEAREFLARAFRLATGLDKEKLAAMLAQCGPPEPREEAAQPATGEGAR